MRAHIYVEHYTYMQSTYCVHAVSFLLRLANSPQSDHQWFSERQTGMPPEARAKGVAAKALAKAAFAVKAKAQSAGLAKGRGAGPQGTLRPSEPAPVATRRYGRKAVPACLQRQRPRDRLPRQRPRQWRPARLGPGPGAWARAEEPCQRVPMRQLPVCGRSASAPLSATRSPNHGSSRSPRNASASGKACQREEMELRRLGCAPPLPQGLCWILG